ncbi:hypothetical protein [Nesterenkonia massiliensis]|uniref:hypothetical protein n=1 Tax=Nesterenkonia massiliensis TaxID=1232429 RepID=UPI00040C109F|nr:hypothetical protein [Nesterenkonia massiliensis]
MDHILAALKSLSSGEAMPVGILAGGAVIHGYMVTDQMYEEHAVSSLLQSASAAKPTEHRDRETFAHLARVFTSKGLGKDSSGETLAVLEAVITIGTITVNVPAMRIDADHVVSWWVTEDRLTGMKFRGGGAGVSLPSL